jgi:hypothetical protein
MQIRLLRHATCVLRLDGRRILTDPMLSRAEAMDPIPNAANARRIPLVNLPLDDEGLKSLIDRLELGAALDEADVLSQVWIPANGETLTFP